MLGHDMHARERGTSTSAARPSSSAVVAAAYVLVAALLLLPLEAYLGVSEALDFVLAILVFTALATLPIALVLLLLARLFGVAVSLRDLGVVAALFVVTPAGIVAAGRVRHDRLERTAVVGDTIVAAIARHHAETGVYPRDLQALVPRFLPEVPRGPLFACAEFEYELPTVRHSKDALERGLRPWRLHLTCSRLPVPLPSTLEYLPESPRGHFAGAPAWRVDD